MSWHFSLALVVAYSADTCSAGAPFAPSSGKPTPQAYLSPDRMTAFSRLSRFGMTCEPLTGTLGADVLTWFLAGFPAKTSAQPEKAQESTANEAECGSTWRGSLARYDRAMSLWRTPQCSLLEDLDVFSGTWPRWGTMRNGECSAQSMPAHLTSATESGSSELWPTPCLPGNGGSNGKAKMKQMLNWPTPTVCGNYNRKGMSPTSGDGLATAVKLWPTPTVQDAKNNGAPSQMERNTKPLNAEVGGSLNPTWVEWLMGWPINWTSLDRLLKQEFNKWHDSFIRQKSSSEIDPKNDTLRNVWWKNDPSEAPQGRKPTKQFVKQSNYSLPEVPYCDSHGYIGLGSRKGASSDLQDMQLHIQAKTQTQRHGLPKAGVPEGERSHIGKTTLGVIARVDRLKAIGNGQVPAVAALAWKTLTNQK